MLGAVGAAIAVAGQWTWDRSGLGGSVASVTRSPVALVILNAVTTSKALNMSATSQRHATRGTAAEPGRCGTASAPAATGARSLISVTVMSDSCVRAACGHRSVLYRCLAIHSANGSDASSWQVLLHCGRRGEEGHRVTEAVHAFALRRGYPLQSPLETQGRPIRELRVNNRTSRAAMPSSNWDLAAKVGQDRKSTRLNS